MDETISTAIDFVRQAFELRIKSATSHTLAYSLLHLDHRPSRCGTTRSTWCGAKRRWPGLCAGRRSSATVADIIVSQQRFIAHSGLDRELLLLQRCGVRRGRLRDSAHSRPDAPADLLVLDPQSCRRASFPATTPALEASTRRGRCFRPWSPVETGRINSITLRCPWRRSMRLRGRSNRQSISKLLDGSLRTTAQVGRKLPTEFRRPRRAGWGGDCPHRRARRSMPCGCTNRPSIRRARTALSRMRRSPMNWRRSSTRRAASKPPATPISEMRGTVTTVGAPTEK